MTSESDPAAWEGDGLPGDDTEALELLWDLGCLPSEVHAMYDCAKREAWVHEKTAKYEDREWHLNVARYFWRRAERLKQLAAQYDDYKGPDQEGETTVGR